MDDFQFLLDLAEKIPFDAKICREQFRAAWTAYCIKNDFDVDTLQYDMACRDLWEKVSEIESDTADWHDFDSFDDFMCGLLV